MPSMVVLASPPPPAPPMPMETVMTITVVVTVLSANDFRVRSPPVTVTDEPSTNADTVLSRSLSAMPAPAAKATMPPEIATAKIVAVASD